MPHVALSETQWSGTQLFGSKPGEKWAPRLNNEILEWLREHDMKVFFSTMTYLLPLEQMTNRFIEEVGTVEFENELDATKFMLRWC